MPRMHSEEYLVFERLHERERQIELQHHLAHQNETQTNNFQRMMVSIGGFFKSARPKNTKGEAT